MSRHTIAQQTILIADSDKPSRETAAAFLRHAGFAVVEAVLPHDVSALIDTTPLALVILCCALPDSDGVPWLQQIREEHGLPIIVLAGQHDVAERIALLRAGADEYLAKPIDGMELVARVEALLRRARAGCGGRVLRFPELTIDMRQYRVTTVAEQNLRLRPEDFQLLCCLAQLPGRVWTRDELLCQVWGTEYLGYDRTVDVTVARLRRSLGACASLVETVPGFGYRFSSGSK